MREIGTALVTGGAGFIGRHLVAALLERGATVKVLDPAVEAARFPGEVEAIAGSILEPDVVRSAMNGIDTLFHMASYAHLWAPDKRLFRQINVLGTELLLEIAVAKDVERIVLTSSETVLRGWRNKSQALIREDDPRPLFDIPGPYTDSKLLQEGIARLASQKGGRIVTVYPTVPVGPGDINMTAPTAMIRNFLSGAAPAYLESVFNFVGVRDVALGHAYAAERGEAGRGYILGGENLKMSEFLVLLGEVSGRPMPTRQVPFWLAYLTAHVTGFVSNRITKRRPMAPVEGVRLARHPKAVDISRARAELAYAPAPVADSLREAVEWLRSEGLVEAQ
jgi:dihydroflavonol-4-reductase